MSLKKVLPLVAAVLIMWSAGAACETSYFSLSTSRVFAPGEEISVDLSTRRAKEIQFRVYRIDDPMTFFLNQRDIHAPAPVRRARIRSGRDLLGEFILTAKQRYRSVLRLVTGSEARGKAVRGLDIRAETQLGASKKAPPVLKQYPLLKKWNYAVQSKQNEEYWDNETVAFKVPKKGVYLVEAVSGTNAAYTVAIVSSLRFIDKTSDHKKTLFVVDWKKGEPVSGASVWFVGDAMKRQWKRERTGRDGMASVRRKRDVNCQIYVRLGDDFLVGDPYFYDSTWNRHRIYMYTERPVYRPGHKMYFKALARARDGRKYSMYAKRKVHVVITDPNYDTVYKKDIRTNESGSLHGGYEIPKTAPVGRYHMQMSIGEDYYEYGDFEVEEYKKPEYSIDIRTDRKSYVAGDVIKANIKARYYFGEPVGEAKVDYFVYKAKYWEPWWKGYEGEYGWYFSGDNEMDTYDYELVSQNTGTLDAQGLLHVDIPTGKVGEDNVYKISVKITDRSRHEVAGAVVVKVAQGTFRIKLDSPNYAWKDGSNVVFNVSSRTIEDVAVSANVDLTVKRYWWTMEKKNNRYNWRRYEKAIKKASVRTDSDGAGRLTFRADGPGSYEVSATSKDARGNQLTSSGDVYVFSTGDGWYERGGEEFEVRADRKHYKPGDTARLIVTSPIKDPTLFVTVEGERVYDYQVIRMKGTTRAVDIPIRDEYFPNVFVKIQSVRGDKSYENETELFVPSKTKFLNISVKPDRKQLRPGDKVNMEVTVTDQKGNPVDAELSLGVVDEAIYAVQPETTPDIRTFFWGRRYNQVETTYSFDFYMSGGSRPFVDYLVKKSRRDTVRYADMKTKNQDRMRRLFKDTMHWEPVARTGRSGKTVITAECPDNLTTWRVTVRASDGDTRVGESIAKFIVRKNIILRIAAPRVFRQGDSMTISTIVHNYLKSAKNVRVSLDAKGVRLRPGGVRTVRIPAGGEKRLDWLADVAAGDRVVLRGAARTDAESDLVEMTFPLIPHGIMRSENGMVAIPQTNGSRNIVFKLPDNASPAAARLTLEVSPSLFGLIQGSIEYLISYPYGCTEQTMSSFLPDVIAARVLKKLGAPTPKSMKELPKMIRAGVDRLKDYQHEDGGWGWWKDDETHPFMTAYVVMGLSEARAAGQIVPESMIENGAQSLLKQLAGENLDTTTRIYMLYALSLAGNKDSSMILKFFAARNDPAVKLNNYGRALMTLTLKRFGLTAQARTAAAELSRRATVKQGMTWWDGVQFHYSWQDDSLETTAQAVRALTAVRPDDARLMSAIRWLIGRRKGVSWNSTRDTAAIVMAVAEYVEAHGDANANFNARISVNGRGSETMTFGKGDIFREPAQRSISSANLRRGVNKIAISKSGPGTLYVSARMEYYPVEEPVPAADNGFALTEKWYRLTPQKQPNGEWLYTRELITDSVVRAGSEVLLEVDVDTAIDREYQMITVPLPAGFEVVADTRGYHIAGMGYEEVESNDQWYSWYTNREVRDDRVVYFNSWFPTGDRTYYTILRAELPGDYHVMPARAELMYYPEVNGNAAETLLRVVESY